MIHNQKNERTVLKRLQMAGMVTMGSTTNELIVTPKGLAVITSLFGPPPEPFEQKFFSAALIRLELYIDEHENAAGGVRN